MKYVLLGIAANDNFGVLSLINGACNLIYKMDKQAKIVYAESYALNDITVQGLEKTNTTICCMNCDKGALLDAVLCKLNFRKQSTHEFVRLIQSADMVIDVYGIYFCNRFKKAYKGRFHTLKQAYALFGAAIIAKMFGKKTVKLPASYGPITQKTDFLMAKWATRWIFDTMYAREQQSAEELEKCSKKQIAVLPDVANLIPYNTIGKSRQQVGFAVSSQIVRNWKSAENYISCMVKAISYVRQVCVAKVILFPNEIHKTNPYNDMHLAREIIAHFPEDNEVEVFDSEKRSFYEQRDSIAACDMVISSRYHACVAALSAAVPTLVIGWHYKYDELMERYHQTQWIIADNDCTSEWLIDRIAQLWNIRQDVRGELEKQSALVKESLYENCNYHKK